LYRLVHLRKKKHRKHHHITTRFPKKQQKRGWMKGQKKGTKKQQTLHVFTFCILSLEITLGSIHMQLASNNMCFNMAKKVIDFDKSWVALEDQHLLKSQIPI